MITFIYGEFEINKSINAYWYNSLFNLTIENVIYKSVDKIYNFIYNSFLFTK